MIVGSIDLDAFELDEPAVYYWVQFINDGIFDDEGFRTYYLDDVYSNREIRFDKEGVDSIDDLPLEDLYNAMQCIYCGFFMYVKTNYFTDKPTRYYEINFWIDDDKIEIVERDIDGNEISRTTRTYEVDKDFIENYKEMYEEWLEYDGEVNWSN